MHQMTAYDLARLKISEQLQDAEQHRRARGALSRRPRATPLASRRRPEAPRSPTSALAPTPSR
jgi:hypothetical protein